MLVNLVPRGSVYTMGDRFIWSPGSVLPVFSVRGIDLLVPPDRFRGIESHVTPAHVTSQSISQLINH